MTEEKRRDTFLLEFYKVCWNNITRAEEAAWKMFAAYTAVLAGLSLASGIIGKVGFLLITIIFSFLAISLSLNANLWFVRNIGIISNLEKEFLYSEDYDSLIPKGYQKKVPFFSLRAFEAWWVLIVSYFGICVTTTGLLLPQISGCDQKIIVIVVFLECFFLTVLYGISLKHRHDRLVEKAKGPEPKRKSPQVPPYFW